MSIHATSTDRRSDEMPGRRMVIFMALPANCDSPSKGTSRLGWSNSRSEKMDLVHGQCGSDPGSLALVGFRSRLLRANFATTWSADGTRDQREDARETRRDWSIVPSLFLTRQKPKYAGMLRTPDSMPTQNLMVQIPETLAAADSKRQREETKTGSGCSDCSAGLHLYRQEVHRRAI